MGSCPPRSKAPGVSEDVDVKRAPNPARLMPERAMYYTCESTETLRERKDDWAAGSRNERRFSSSWTRCTVFCVVKSVEDAGVQATIRDILSEARAISRGSRRWVWTTTQDSSRSWARAAIARATRWSGSDAPEKSSRRAVDSWRA